MNCPVCGSDKLSRFREIRLGTDLSDYWCRCETCGESTDLFGINDLVYAWGQLPQCRKFEVFYDYRDEGGKIGKHAVDFDADVNSPDRIKNC
jgi:transcription elongation factor Elf1